MNLCLNLNLPFWSNNTALLTASKWAFFSKPCPSLINKTRQSWVSLQPAQTHGPAVRAAPCRAPHSSSGSSCLWVSYSSRAAAQTWLGLFGNSIFMSQYKGLQTWCQNLLWGAPARGTAAPTLAETEWWMWASSHLVLAFGFGQNMRNLANASQAVYKQIKSVHKLTHSCAKWCWS